MQSFEHDAVGKYARKLRLSIAMPPNNEEPFESITAIGRYFEQLEGCGQDG